MKILRNTKLKVLRKYDLQIPTGHPDFRASYPARYSLSLSKQCSPNAGKYLGKVNIKNISKCR